MYMYMFIDDIHVCTYMYIHVYNYVHVCHHNVRTCVCTVCLSTYMYIVNPPIFNPRRMRSEGYGTCLVCLSVCLLPLF